MKHKDNHFIGNMKNIVIGIAIVILTFLVIFQGIQTFYPSPKYSDFCEERIAKPIATDQQTCLDFGGQWNDYEGARPIAEGELTGYCNRDFTCRQEYEDTREIYSKNLFIITTILGIILLVVGGVLFELEAVGAGIMGGSIITFIYGTGSYWSFAGDAFRFIISIVGLILVVLLAYWLNNRKKKKKWKFSLKIKKK